ncbi:hypothetical protein [Blastococcus tunisiensis]|uniref:Nudix hydrolase domain-containing protein n=1 Tax=Blastococcus tunisiensis TaxID=1798228 RepID=A0A1I1VN68_9ACTN|nr:hypothetical protein [Blastococcus sp. DSM 46838]SFD84245.1 hypothetical protein SAMN05216574_10130 [Blastococcus sp. DSM 46838]
MGEWATSGVTGLLVGGAVGLLLSVLFEDTLKKGLYRGRRKVRVRGRRARPPAPRETFSLGPLKTSHLVIEGDGVQEIAEESVTVIVEPSFVTLPPDVAARREEIAVEQAHRRAEGLPAAWNGPSYAIARFSVSRRPDDEAPEVFVRLRHSDFFTFLATQELDVVGADGQTLRERYLGGDPLKVEPFMSSSFGVNIAVVTADHRLLISRRSDRVQTARSLWSSSANEALSRSIDSAGRQEPSFHGVARRGLCEELSLDDDEYGLKLLTFCLDTATHQWGATFVARLHSLTSTELEERWSRGAPDAWEHDRHCFVRFVPEDVFRFVLAPERRDRWTATGPPLYFYALANEYGRARVEKAIRTVAREPAGRRRRGRRRAASGVDHVAAGEHGGNARR